MGAAVALSGCEKLQDLECTSPDAQAVVSSLLSDEIAKSTKEQLGEAASATQTTEAKIRATVAQIKILIEDVRTTKKDPDSTKRFCEGTVKIVMPLGMIGDADRAREALGADTVATLTQRVGFERAADTFSRQLHFTVQPTDDKKKVFGEVEDFGLQLTTLGEIVASHLVAPTLSANQQAAAAEADALAAELAQQTAAQTQVDFDLATADNKLATQAINEIWKSLPEETRTDMLEMQRAWIKKKTADCNIKAAEASTDTAVKEAVRLRCDTEATRSRSDELRELIEN